jgi:rfaE bifunctional protein kinase chain/domain
LTISPERAKQILDRFTGLRTLVVGDVMLDEYVWGKVSRISPEAPVMVVDAERHTHVPGGAANVVNNLCALGAKSAIAGLVGADDAGAILVQKLKEEGADVAGVIATPLRPTTRKTRIFAHSQQVVRVDHEHRAAADAESAARLAAHLKDAVAQCDAVLLSDYRKGVLTEEVVGAAVDLARAAGKVVTGNLKPATIGPHCRLTVMTLNLPEASAATGIVLDDGATEDDFHAAGKALLDRSGADHVLITRGPHGLNLYGADGTRVHVPPYLVEVYDSAGAGDTVISTLTLAIAAGATPVEAVVLANYAGAEAVKKLGVATVSREEILHTVASDQER